MKKSVKIGNITVGGGNPVAVQTMLTKKASDFDAAREQLLSCANVGADIVRLAVCDDDDVIALKELKRISPVPLVADIHFDYKLAIKSVEAGVDKIRINPGNIGGKREIKAVSDCLKDYGIPVRVGSNSGSIEKEFLEKYGRSSEALAESVLYSARLLEEFGVENIVLSAKASDVKTTVDAYRILNEKCVYPLHIGVTEAGTYLSGTVKGAVGLGALLLDGIGDTVRVSLSAPPEEEVRIARKILRSVGLGGNFAEVVACPTCGRCDYDCMALAAKIEKATENVHKRIKIAVMGCIVNGIGEGKDADVGIAGGKDKCAIMRGGEVVRTVLPEDAEKELTKEIDLWLKNN